MNNGSRLIVARKRELSPGSTPDQGCRTAPKAAFSKFPLTGMVLIGKRETFVVFHKRLKSIFIRDLMSSKKYRVILLLVLLVDLDQAYRPSQYSASYFRLFPVPCDNPLSMVINILA